MTIKEEIAKLIKQGFTEGYHPRWKLECEEMDKLTEMDIEYIALLVDTGYDGGYEPYEWELEIEK